MCYNKSLFSQAFCMAQTEPHCYCHKQIAYIRWLRVELYYGCYQPFWLENDGQINSILTLVERERGKNDRCDFCELWFVRVLSDQSPIWLLIVETSPSYYCLWLSWCLLTSWSNTVGWNEGHLNFHSIFMWLIEGNLIYVEYSSKSRQNYFWTSIFIHRLNIH